MEWSVSDFFCLIHIDSSSRLPRAAKCVRKTVLEFLKSQLPAECQVHGVVTSGVVGKSYSQEQVVELHELCRKEHNFSVFFESRNMYLQYYVNYELLVYNRNI